VGRCDLGGTTVASHQGGRLGVCGGGRGLGGSRVGGRRGDRELVRVGGRVVWSFCPLAETTAATLVLAAAVLVCTVCRLAVIAAATCLWVCGGVRFGWSARCPSLCFSRCYWRRWRRCGRFESWRSPRRPRACRCVVRCGFGGTTVASHHCGRLGASGVGGGSGSSRVSGRRVDRVLFGVGGPVAWSFCLMAKATAVAFVLAVAAAAAWSSVCGGVHFGWPARCPSSRWARWCRRRRRR